MDPSLNSVGSVLNRTSEVHRVCLCCARLLSRPFRKTIWASARALRIRPHLRSTNPCFGMFVEAPHGKMQLDALRGEHWAARTFGEGEDAKDGYRVNLGCVEGLDPLALEISIIDGEALPVIEEPEEAKRQQAGRGTPVIWSGSALVEERCRELGSLQWNGSGEGSWAVPAVSVRIRVR